ncbi:MAG: hypothetical protein WCP57_05510 [Bacteroidota bacterium]
MSLINPKKNEKDKKKSPIAKSSKFGMAAAKGGGAMKSQTSGSNNAAARSKAAGRGS